MDQEDHRSDRTTTIIAIGILIGFFAVLGCLLFVELPATGHDALLVMLGALVAAMGDMRSFYFGSSKSSEQKNTMMQSMIDKTPNVAPIVVQPIPEVKP